MLSLSDGYYYVIEYLLNVSTHTWFAAQAYEGTHARFYKNCMNVLLEYCQELCKRLKSNPGHLQEYSVLNIRLLQFLISLYNYTMLKEHVAG